MKAGRSPAEKPSSFDLGRLAALKEYATLEYELCLLFRNVLGANDDAAAAVFYQITNTRSRYGIITSLIEINHAGMWPSWKGISKLMRPCDEARNHLIHWFEDAIIEIALRKDDGEWHGAEATEIPNLRNPTRRWHRSPDETVYDEAKVWAARDQIRVMKHIINRFALVVAHPESWPWQHIFQQPLSGRSATELLQQLNHKGHAALLPPYDR